MTLTANEQYLLELMNRARLDPAAEAARMGIDLNEGLAAGTIQATAKQVLAPNAFLEAAATSHTLWMLDADVFSHTGEGGSSHIDRANAAGYLTGYVSENIAWTGTTGAINQLTMIEDMHRNLFLSEGHRVNLMNAAMRETGIGAESGVFTTSRDWNATVMTLMFGSLGTDRFLTGVAYDDTNGNRFYSVGEGRSGVTFASGGEQTTTASAGGYGLGLVALAATAVTGLVGGKAFSLVVDMSQGNVKLDVLSGTTFCTSGNITLLSGIHHATLLGVAGLNATGNAQRNVLTGNKGSNALTGGGGDDALKGLGGADTLDGGLGIDRLTGGRGADGLTGGAGADRFVFQNRGGADRVSDFDLIEGDRLILDAALWGGSALNSAQVVSQFAGLSGGDVVLSFGGGDVLRLVGVTSMTGLAVAIDLI